MSTAPAPVPLHPEGQPFAGYPFFVDPTSAQESWNKLTPEQRARYLRAVPYLQEEYSGETLSVGMIGTIIAFGG